MQCSKPFPAWQLEDGTIVFSERGKVLRSLTLPCGQCAGCRTERARQWAVRCMHEASQHKHNCFITLTYDLGKDHGPFSLNYTHFQLFMKRLRKHFNNKRIRFYMCGEYTKRWHAHFHAILFGVDFPDKLYFKRVNGNVLYTSKILGDLWRYGFHTIGSASFESAGYCARYICDKVTGDLAEQHYSKVDPLTGEIVHLAPEFNRMSLKPGIGGSWFDKYHKDVFPHDHVIVNSKPRRPPRYYDNRMVGIDPFTMESIGHKRYLRGIAHAASGENSDERIAARAACLDANLSRLSRSL